jgi:hypothetical protein
MSRRVAVLNVEDLADMLDGSVIHQVTELPSMNIIAGNNEVSGDFIAVSSIHGDCVVIAL